MGPELSTARGVLEAAHERYQGVTGEVSGSTRALYHHPGQEVPFYFYLRDTATILPAVRYFFDEASLPVAEAERDEFPAGKAFCAGEGPDTRMLNLATWDWTEVAERKSGARHDGCSVLLPLVPPDYRARILTFGGGEIGGPRARSTETAEIIDFGLAQPGWEWADSLQEARVNACAVILPDSTILAVGGNRTGRFDEPALATELFDPNEDRWRPLAPITVPRGYHATALLLPDGRVLSSGTTPYGSYELRMEVFSPPYLFRGPRPKIEELAERISYDEPFEVRYDYPGAVAAVVLLRPGAMTHAFDMEQRHVQLGFSSEGRNSVTVQAPPDPHVAPPGYCMLFLLGEETVPSEAAFVRLTAAG